MLEFATDSWAFESVEQRARDVRVGARFTTLFGHGGDSPGPYSSREALKRDVGLKEPFGGI